MKKFLIFLVINFSVTSFFSLDAQRLISNSRVTGVCYAGTKINRIYIPPPFKVKERSGSKGGGTITVIYTGFTPSAKNAVDFAVNILETMLPADLRMTVKTSWTKISTAGVLGNSSIRGFAAGWAIDAFKPYAYYPLPVAEKIGGKAINEDFEADVELELNSSINWYLGTDGNTPTNKYDLVTVVLHELCHGLGFFDSMNVGNSVGFYGMNNLPIIYDTFIENLAGKKLTDTTLFVQNSASLYHELVGNNLYFNGPLTFKYLAGNRARLYAPSTWDSGSSVSHLDELRTAAVNSLMTPYIDLGEAIHNPGNLTLSILGDVGWINTRILPADLKDTEDHMTLLNISASIRSDTTYNKNNVTLVYSYDDFRSSSTLIMTGSSIKNNFTASVAIPSYNSKLSYYFSVEDIFLRVYRSPSFAEKKPYTVYVGIDTVKPRITHTPNEYYFEKIDSILFEASVTDNLGVDTVYIEYSINSGPLKTFGLNSRGQDKYNWKLNVKPEQFKGGNFIKYRIIAIDKASGHNTGYLPSSGYDTIKIESLNPVVSSYLTDFSDASDEFFNSGFEIAKPSGFNSFALHSEHPYRSPDEDFKSLNFSSVLRHPVIFDGTGMVISFRELVLVEPGEPGSIFGFSDFYDYVILEGSKDYGKNWFSLTDGYDSRFYSPWETSYNSLTDGQNSTFVGKESMMLTHTFYPKVADRISDGDSLLIRFRLFSDPYAHGWGWAIDDLKINKLIDQAGENKISAPVIYPNPGNGNLTIDMVNEFDIKQIFVSVYNSTGQCIMNDMSFPDKKVRLNISSYPSGIYFILIRSNNRMKSVKYTLIK